jgi:Tfp pilus assembly PilM family ATPase
MPIGIFIDTNTVKVARSEKRWGKVIVSELITEDILEGILPEVTVDYGAKKEKIVSILKRHLMPNEEVFLTIPSQEVIIRSFQIPRLPKKEWAEAITFEGQKYIPFKLDEVETAFYILHAGRKTNNMNVVFFAIKKNRLKYFVSILEEVGVVIKAVEPEIMSLLRILRFNKDISLGEIAGVLNVNDNSVSLGIFGDNMIYLTRDFSFLSRPTAENPEPILKLIRELEVSFDYANKQFPALLINKIVLTGKGAVPEWADRMTKSSEIRTALAKPSLNLSSQGVELDFKNCEVLGAAIRGLVGTSIDVTLYKQKEEKRTAIRNFRFTIKRIPKWLVIQVTILSLILFGFKMFISYQFDRIQKLRFESLKLMYPYPKATEAELRKTKILLRKKLEDFNKLLNSRDYWTPRLSEFPRMLPYGVWLSKIVIDDYLTKEKLKFNSCVVEGYVYTPQEKDQLKIVGNLLKMFREADEFSKKYSKIEVRSVEQMFLMGNKVTKFKLFLE